MSKSIIVSLAAAIAALSIGLSTSTNADPTWTTLANIPAPNGIGANGAAIGGKIYVPGGGWDIAFVGGAPYNTLFAYDIATDQWSNLPSLPYDISSAPVTAVGSTVYLIGGITNQPCCGPTNTLFAYDTNVGAWSSSAMPFDSEQGCSSVINGKIYVTGPDPHIGNQVVWANLFYSYDPANDSWTQLASPSQPHQYAMCGAISNKFYLAGGQGQDSTVLNTVEAYDPGSNSWTTLAPMPTGVNNANNNAAGFGNQLYVFGGKPAGLTTCGTLVSQVQIYDPQSNSWSSPYNLPYSPMLAEMGAVAAAGGIYLVGGSDSCGTTYGTFVKLVPPSTYVAQVQPPINADGSSSFNAKRGVVPVIFTLTINGVASCDLPAATISVTRTGNGAGSVDQSVYEMQADNGSNFRISDCQWVYNLNSKALGAGTYQVGLSGEGVTGTATFALQ